MCCQWHSGTLSSLLWSRLARLPFLSGNLATTSAWSRRSRLRRENGKERDIQWDDRGFSEVWKVVAAGAHTAVVWVDVLPELLHRSQANHRPAAEPERSHRPEVLVQSHEELMQTASVDDVLQVPVPEGAKSRHMNPTVQHTLWGGGQIILFVLILGSQLMKGEQVTCFGMNLL